MTDDIKKALEICLTDESCEPCVYLNDPDCDRKLKADAYQLICSQENTIAYLMDLNKKLSTELQQTKFLKGETE